VAGIDDGLQLKPIIRTSQICFERAVLVRCPTAGKVFTKESDRYALRCASNEQAKECAPEWLRRSHVEDNRVIVDKPLGAVSDPFDRFDQRAFCHGVSISAFAPRSSNASGLDPVQTQTARPNEIPTGSRYRDSQVMHSLPYIEQCAAAPKVTGQRS